MKRVMLIPVALLATVASAQGIPAVSGVLDHKVSKTVIEGTPATLTLTVNDRPAAFFAKCTFGQPAEEVQAESEVKEAGKSFVLALPVDTKARTAECAVVARFANGLSERKAVKMQWEVVPPPPEEEPAEDAEAPPAPADTPPPADPAGAPPAK